MDPAAEQLWRGAYGATAPTLSAARSGQLGEVLMEGELVKQGESPLPAMLMTPPWANRHFVLTGRVALYYESALAQNNKSKGGIFVPGCRVETAQVQGRPFCLRVSSQAPRRPPEHATMMHPGASQWLLDCRGQQQQQAWFAALTSVACGGSVAATAAPVVGEGTAMTMAAPMEAAPVAAAVPAGYAQSTQPLPQEQPGALAGAPPVAQAMPMGGQPGAAPMGYPQGQPMPGQSGAPPGAPQVAQAMPMGGQPGAPPGAPQVAQAMPMGGQPGAPPGAPQVAQAMPIGGQPGAAPMGYPQGQPMPGQPGAPPGAPQVAQAMPIGGQPGAPPGAPQVAQAMPIGGQPGAPPGAPQVAQAMPIGGQPGAAPMGYPQGQPMPGQPGAPPGAPQVAQAMPIGGQPGAPPGAPQVAQAMPIGGQPGAAPMGYPQGQPMPGQPVPGPSAATHHHAAMAAGAAAEAASVCDRWYSPLDMAPEPGYANSNAVPFPKNRAPMPPNALRNFVTAPPGAMLPYGLFPQDPMCGAIMAAGADNFGGNAPRSAQALRRQAADGVPAWAKLKPSRFYSDAASSLRGLEQDCERTRSKAANVGNLPLAQEAEAAKLQFGRIRQHAQQIAQTVASSPDPMAKASTAARYASGGMAAFGALPTQQLVAGAAAAANSMRGFF